MLCTNIIVACLGATVLAKGYYQRPNHGQAGRGFIVCQRAGIGEKNWIDDCDNHMKHAPSENCKFCMFKCMRSRESEGNRNICKQCILGGCDVVACGGKNRIPECVDKWSVAASKNEPEMTGVPFAV